MNALYLQLFPQLALIDPLGRGEQDAHGEKDINGGKEKPILRLASPEAFKADLGGQFRFWKMTKEDNKYIISEVQDGVPLEKYVDELICEHVSGLETDAKTIQAIKWYKENKQSQLDRLKQKQSQKLNEDEQDEKKQLEEELKKLETEKDQIQKYKNKQRRLEKLKARELTQEEKKQKRQLEKEFNKQEKFEKKLHQYFDKLRSKLFKEPRDMPNEVKAMHERMKTREWWKRTITLARSQEALELFDTLRSPTISQVNPSDATIFLVRLIAKCPPTEETNTKEKGKETVTEEVEEMEVEEEKEKEVIVEKVDKKGRNDEKKTDST